jgi:signal transduction histidine kinase
LVDDQPRNLALLEALLRPLGHQLFTADGGDAAIALFEAHSLDLVLLDLVMPGVDGLAVLAHIRRHPRGAHLPVIVVTAHSEREHRLRGLEAGADEFLEKPVDRAILLARVRTLLQLKESRDELQASRDMLAGRNTLLEQLQREQQELTQFIVHDLKSPLSVVAGNLQWARENISNSSTDDFAEALTEANDSVSRMREMIDDLLTVARLEGADLTVRCEIVSVGDLLRALIETYVRKARSKGVLLLPLAEGNCDFKVRADPSLLRRVFENILDNALRYTPASGRIGVVARQGEAIEIKICNTGPPIPPSDRERIFEKFARGKSERPSAGNAGLGLYFCKCAIEALDGKIVVLEVPEWPTCFLIELPPAR